MKTTICSAANTIVPAVLVLRAKGFEASRSKVTENQEKWVAEADNIRFSAEDPLVLLGLQTMYESRRSNWKATDGEIEAFLTEFP